MKRIKDLYTRIRYKIMFEGWYWNYGDDMDGCSWKCLKVLGLPQQRYLTSASHDCSGQQFCYEVNRYLFGLVTVGYYAVDC
jgi:hypothetical protein